jgi:peptidoglycan hydrolase-like protein with peptidoglycan-binding domain
MNIKNIKYIKIFLLFLLLTLTLPVYAITKSDVDTLVELGIISEDQIGNAYAVLSGFNSQQNSQQIQKSVAGKQASSISTRLIAGTDKTGCLDFTLSLYEGISGTVVSALQAFLKSEGYFDLEPTGYFGRVTAKAVEDFQKARKIVLSGTPETTGLGVVGPKTREIIEKLTCVVEDTGEYYTSADFEYNDGVGTDTEKFFGYSLSELFNYEPDFNYENIISGGETDYSYNPNFDYAPDFDFNYEKYTSDFEYETGNWGGDPVEVELEVLAANGKFIKGDNGKRYILVDSRTIELQWESDNAYECNLYGDFPQRDIIVPTHGNIQVYLVNPSYSMEIIDPDYDEYGTPSKPVFAFRLNCYQKGLYGKIDGDTVMVHILEEENNDD